MPAKTLMHSAEEPAPRAKWQHARYAMQQFPLLLFLLHAHLSFDTVHKELQCLWHQHHTGDTLRTKQPEQRIGDERARIEGAGSGLKHSHLDSEFKCVT